jgi:hypothetical protein
MYALDELPEFMSPPQLAPVVHKTVSSLAQDRYLRRGIPYTRSGRKILYARQDVVAYLTARRTDPEEATA